MTEEQLSFAEQQVVAAFGRTNERGEFAYSTDEAMAGVVFSVVTLAYAGQVDLQALPDSLNHIFQLYFSKNGIASNDPKEVMEALQKQLLADLSPELIRDLTEAVTAIAREESTDSAEALAKTARAVTAERADSAAGLKPPSSSSVNLRGKKA